MFTGLIEEKAQVVANQSNEHANRLTVLSNFDEVQTGESIAVNGVCLTVLPAESRGLLHFDISPETLRLTTLSKLSPGDFVNLERAMLASSRFGGHYVSGHVDTTALVKSIQAIDEYTQVELAGFSEQALLYLIAKGSITVEGVSLTINAVVGQTIQLMLIPHTLLRTSLSLLTVGQSVNIEFDYFTRIVAHQLQLFGKLNCEVEV